MTQRFDALNRRDFVKTISVAAAGLTTALPALSQPVARRNIKLGFDSYSIRALRLKAPALIDYAVKLKLDSLFIADLGAWESQDDKYLSDLRKRAADQGVDLCFGIGSICPTAAAFNPRQGTAEQQLAEGIRMAKAVGSPFLRVILGNGPDRKSPGGIEARMADTVKVCQQARTRALDAGVKIAFENHTGDMQGWELASLVEAAGKDYVGITFDTGNAVSAVEDPMSAFEIMAPYIVTTHVRDTMIWEYEDGARMQWCAPGEGLVDWNKFVDRLSQRCPGVAVHFEIISGSNADLPYLKPEFWDVWPKARAADFAKFVALAKRGKSREPHPWPQDRTERAKAEQEYQQSELAKSVTYAREKLGLGLKTA
jgi:sugar phosphate isomerase/epimerase